MLLEVVNLPKTSFTAFNTVSPSGGVVLPREHLFPILLEGVCC